MTNYFTYTNRWLYFLIFLPCIMLVACTTTETAEFDIQGHRGCRGLLPENSIPAFLKAVDLGVNTLEMDVVITADKQVLVSHEPWISDEICHDIQGGNFDSHSPDSFNIYKMTAAEAQQFDCGSAPHPRFANQERMAVYKPLLSEVIDQVELHAKNAGKKPLAYNIEIKSLPAGDGKFHPMPAEFCSLVIAVLNERNVLERSIIQSFDRRVMEELHNQAPEVTTAWLIEDQPDYEAALQQLSFQPNIYSCFYELLTQDAIIALHAKGMKVIPWTVNNREVMEELIAMGVDGIITDYPDIAIDLHLEILSGAEKASEASLIP